MALKNSEILVRASTRYVFLCLPGGAVQAGELISRSAEREWQEEIGLPCGPLELIRDWALLRTSEESARMCFAPPSPVFSSTRPARKNSLDAQTIFQSRMIGLIENFFVHGGQPPFAVLDETNLMFEWLSVSEIPLRSIHPIGLTQLLQVPVGSGIHLAHDW